MEAQLQAEEGPSTGAILVVAPGETKTLGRGPGADLRLDDPALAARHIAVRLAPDGLQAIDLGAPGGSRRNGAPLPARSPTPVDSGDLLQVGAHALRVLVLGAPARQRADESPFPPDELGGVRRLAGGASGKVYRAVWLTQGGREVALKLLRDEFGPGTQERARFLRECRTVARLRSPFVVAVFDVREVGERVYTIMELIEGQALDVRLAQRGALEVPAAMRVAEDVARALGAAQDGGQGPRPEGARLEQVRERGAVHPLEDEEARAARERARGQDANDVRVIDGRRGLDLDQEPVGPVDRRGRQDLDRHLGAAPPLPGRPDATHGAGPEEGADVVAGEVRWLHALHGRATPDRPRRARSATGPPAPSSCTSPRPSR